MEKTTIRMRWLLCLSVICLGFVGCDEDENAAVATDYFIQGEKKVNPGETVKYIAGISDAAKQNSGDRVWSVSDATIAEIVSASETSSRTEAEVKFLSTGQVSLILTDGTKSGSFNITVNAIAASGMTAAFEQGIGVLKSGAKDTVFFSFDADLAALPTIRMNGTNVSDTSGFFKDDKGKAIAPFNSTGEVLSALSAYNESKTKYYAIYEAGTGDGQPEAVLESIKVTDQFGGDELDSLFVKLPMIDNTAPVGEISFSKSSVADSTTVEITVSFSEAMRAPRSTKADTLAFVNISGAGVKAVTDTLWATDDPSIWTLSYLTNGNGDGSLTVSVDNIVDLGGNLIASMTVGDLLIDNTPPVASGTASAVSGSQAISIETEGWWLVVEDGADEPTGLADFSSDSSGDSVFTVAAGTYDVYFISVDQAGNESEIVSQLGIIVN